VHTALAFPRVSAPGPFRSRLFAVTVAAPFSVTAPTAQMRAVPVPAATLPQRATPPAVVASVTPPFPLLMPAAPTVRARVFLKLSAPPEAVSVQTALQLPSACAPAPFSARLFADTAA